MCHAVIITVEIKIVIKIVVITISQLLKIVKLLYTICDSCEIVIFHFEL